MRSHDLIAAELSRDIYLDQPEFERACALAGLEPVKFYDHAGSQAALVRRADAAWLVFRGTEASRGRVLDMVANIKVAAKPWAGEGWVHDGYADALGRIQGRARRMAEIVSSSIPLYVTGHSMGGAMAVGYASLVTLDPEYGHKVAALITFGAPKFGNAAAVDPLRDRMEIRRYVMPMDPAPLWPLLMFRHPVPATWLKPTSWWPGPVSRHSADGYAVSVAALT